MKRKCILFIGRMRCQTFGVNANRRKIVHATNSSKALAPDNHTLAACAWKQSFRTYACHPILCVDPLHIGRRFLPSSTSPFVPSHVDTIPLLFLSRTTSNLPRLQAVTLSLSNFAMATFTELKPSATEMPAAPAEAPAASSSAPAALSTLSVVAGLVPSLESLKERMGDVWARSRPWSEFMNTAQMSKPEFSELFERVKENAEYYAFNYLVILLLMSALTIFSSMLAFLGGLFIVLAYFYLYFLNPEPIVVAGITLDNNIKAAFIMLFSLVMLWLTGAGATFTTLVGVVGIVALTHASVRRPPGEADFETAYTPATV